MEAVRQTTPKQMSFILPQTLKQHMLDHVLETPELEVCGLLAGNSSGLTSLYRIPNIAEDPVTTFYMQPQAQIATLKIMRQSGEQLSGIYHSHPNSEALPSNKDLQQATYPGTAYLIVSLMELEPVIRSFMFDGEMFQDLKLEFR